MAKALPTPSTAPNRAQAGSGRRATTTMAATTAAQPRTLGSHV